MYLYVYISLSPSPCFFLSLSLSGHLLHSHFRSVASPLSCNDFDRLCTCSPIYQSGLSAVRFAVARDGQRRHRGGHASVVGCRRAVHSQRRSRSQAELQRASGAIGGRLCAVAEVGGRGRWQMRVNIFQRTKEPGSSVGIWGQTTRSDYPVTCDGHRWSFSSCGSSLRSGAGRRGPQQGRHDRCGYSRHCQPRAAQRLCAARLDSGSAAPMERAPDLQRLLRVPQAVA